MSFWKAVEVALVALVASIIPACLLVQRRNRLREEQAKQIFRETKIKD